MKTHIEKCLSGNHLTVEEASSALDKIWTGQSTEAQIAGLLIALRAKGETVDEIVGFARTMREHSVKLKIEDPDAIDMCGTGGDGTGTINISTIASFVVAGAGVTVAKHGNRSVSSQSGSADVLAELGVDIQCSPEITQDCINRNGIGFLFAPLYHPAMKYAAKPRRELGVRSIFNMLGPLTNPAGVKRQLIGVYQSSVTQKIAFALQKLDAERACVVHSSDGMDEVALSGPTLVQEVNKNKELRQYNLQPDDFGLPHHPIDKIHGGDKSANAEVTLDILKGRKSAARDVVVANAALGIYISGKAADLREGRMKAEESIDSGRAFEKLQQLIKCTSQK
jgi:anthranilate phosphoribosyltransferase